MSNKFNQLGKNTALMFIGTFASKILIFLLVPLYTSVLSTSEYGIADIMTTTINLLIPILTLTLSEGILRLTLDSEIDNKQIFSIGINIIMIGFIILIITSPFLGYYLAFDEFIVYFLMYYLSTVLLLEIQCFVKGLDHVSLFVKSGILSTFVMCMSNVLFLGILRLGVKGYLLAFILGNTISVVYLIFKEKLWHYLLPYKLISKQVVKQLLCYCLPLIVNSISWWINNSSDKYILKAFWGISLTGIYSVSYKIPSLISSFAGIMTSALQISAIDDFGSDDSVQFFSKVNGMYTALFFVGSSFSILFCKVLAKFLFVGNFYIAWKYSVFLILAVVFQALGSFVGVIYTSAKKTNVILYTTMGGAFLNILFNFLLIPKWGATGAAIATLIGFFAIWIIRLIDSRKILPIKIDYSIMIISIIFILIQIIVIFLGISSWYLYSGVLFLAVIFVNHKLLFDLIIMVAEKRGKRGRINEQK